MDLKYRIDTDSVLPVFHILESVYIDLTKQPESVELYNFCKDFYKSIRVIRSKAESMGFIPDEAVGYFKIKAYLEIAGSHVTIPKEEYDRLKADSERLQDL